ncbi:sugar phosphate nucleotidyltransferase [Paenibacillus elgii]|uniref:sugar phosphate nucleotidyltransferase n=1 Tax=Paenibacillus elgii TaxID=189691 RepID=UPI0013D1C22D|nr:sugar phosphate nucleotidyltransferase [Paenibacillus elgii]
MKYILLSGGSGKRLWPLSNDTRSKQFLKVLRNDEGQLESMVERVWRQLKNADIDQSAYVATGKVQREILQSQIGEQVPLIIEPERRDTFPAIALAAVYLYSVESVSLEECVAILPVDPYVEDPFFEHIKKLEHVLRESKADLALMGVKPTFPSEKYGYIVPEPSSDSSETFMRVANFQEKPTQSKAEELIAQSALWNCGIFAFKLDFLITLLIKKGLPIQYEELARQYGKMDKISFDYEVVEKTKNIAMLSYDGVWKDLGTWNTLTEEMSTPIIGTGIMTDASQNTHLVNELNIPITVLDVPDVVVAASPDGILVASKESTPKIKDIIKSIEQPPMYEERVWGKYRVLDCVLGENDHKALTRRLCILAGKHHSYQVHRMHDEVLTVLSGMGEMILDERLQPIQAGDVIRIPAGTRHSIRALTDLELIEIQNGTGAFEENTVELCTTWTEIVRLCI